MKTSRYLLVLFLISLFLLLPIFTPQIESKLYPFEPKVISVNVKTTSVQIDVSVDVDVLLNVSIYDPQNEEIISILNLTIFQTTTIDNLPEQGVYIFHFFTFVLADLVIHQVGIPLLSPVIVIFLGMLNLGIYVYERYFSIVVY